MIQRATRRCRYCCRCLNEMKASEETDAFGFDLCLLHSAVPLKGFKVVISGIMVCCFVSSRGAKHSLLWWFLHVPAISCHSEQRAFFCLHHLLRCVCPIRWISRRSSSCIHSKETGNFLSAGISFLALRRDLYHLKKKKKLCLSLEMSPHCVCCWFAATQWNYHGGGKCA